MKRTSLKAIAEAPQPSLTLLQPRQVWAPPALGHEPGERRVSSSLWRGDGLRARGWLLALQGWQRGSTVSCLSWREGGGPLFAQGLWGQLEEATVKQPTSG